MNDREIGWGVIGAGAVCERKGGPPLYGVDGCRLIGVTRRDREQGEDYARRHGPCRYFPTIEELLAQDAIDAIYVATPPSEHATHTEAAAKAGKHVLCEKPMAMNARECQRMVAICADHGVVLAVAYYRRCYPTVLRARRILDDGAIGQLRRVWLNDEFPISHRLDLVHFFCGEAKRVWAGDETLAPGSHADRGPVLHAETEAGAEAVTNVGWQETGAPEMVELEGDRGRILIGDLKGGRLRWRGDDEERSESLGGLEATHWGIVENFRNHLTKGTPLVCSGEDGRKSSVVLDIASSLEPDGGALDVDYDNPPDADQQRGAGLGLLA